MTTEDDVRRVLAERADLAPDPSRLLAGVRSRSRSARRRFLAAGATAVAASAAVAATVAVVFLPFEPDPRPAAAPTAGFEPGWLPEGYREVSRTAYGEVLLPGYRNLTTRLWVTDENRDRPAISVSISPGSADSDQEGDSLPGNFSRQAVTVRGISGSSLKLNDGRELCSLLWREGGLQISVNAMGQREGACATALRIAESGRLTEAPVRVPTALRPGWTPERTQISTLFQRKRKGVCSTGIHLGETGAESPSATVFVATLSNEDTEFAPGGTPVDAPAGPARFYEVPLDQAPRRSPEVVVDLEGPWTLTVARLDDAPWDTAELVRFTRELKVTSFPECDF